MTQDSANEATSWVMLNLFQHLTPDINRLKPNSYTKYHYNDAGGEILRATTNHRVTMDVIITTHQEKSPRKKQSV